MYCALHKRSPCKAYSSHFSLPSAALYHLPCVNFANGFFPASQQQTEMSFSKDFPM